MISANLVKDLRDKTGAGMMDCKKALVETNGDLEAAIDWIRKKGLAAAAKKSGRTAAEGLTAAAVEGRKGAVIELNSETDFVARNSSFQECVAATVKAALQCNTLDDLQSYKLDSGKTVVEEVTHNIAVIGENLYLRRMATISVEHGIVASYVHNSISPEFSNLGKIAVLVGLESTASDTKALESLGKQIAMHIAAVRPEAVDISAVDPELVQREKNIFIEQARASGKPDNVIEKMVEGRIRKFYEEIVLLEQIFVVDGKTKISDVLKEHSNKLGAEIKIKNFVCFKLGEGVEVAATDFAAEVAATIKG